MARECSHVDRAGLVTNVDPATWPEGVREVAAFESRAVCGRVPQRVDVSLVR